MKSQEKLTWVDSKSETAAASEDITKQWLKTRLECSAASKICKEWKEAR